MNKGTTYKLRSGGVVGCRVGLLEISSWSCLPSVLPMVCIKTNTMLKHCGGSPKWLEEQSLQGKLLYGRSLQLDFCYFLAWQ